MSGGRLGLGEGTALYIGAVLGPGVLALPALAAAAAGPASVVAWAGLLALSVPVAVVFATLGTRFPDGGGVSTFVAKAFGASASATVGWWFYAAVPFGVVSGAMIGGEYVAEALGMGEGIALASAAVILLAAVVANCVGLSLSGRLQLILVGVLVLLLVGAMAAASPDASWENFTPFAPHGWGSIGSAAVLIFYAFSGWEAASHLSAEFSHPRRDLPAATGVTLVVVGALYLGLCLVTIAVLGDSAGNSHVPLMMLLEVGLGPAARVLTAVAAVCLTFGAVNTFIAGAVRLGAALGRDGVLPRYLAKGSNAGEVPRRSLSVQAALVALLMGTVVAVGIDLDPLMRVTSVLLSAVTTAGMAAGVALLPSRRPLWWAAVMACAMSALVLLWSGWMVLLPVGLAGCALGAKRRLNRPVPEAEQTAVPSLVTSREG
ncbi:amino acid permease [Streptomyces sp. TM32]|nr:amino acid permease [Streptomyces sp. TM32]